MLHCAQNGHAVGTEPVFASRSLQPTADAQSKPNAYITMSHNRTSLCYKLGIRLSCTPRRTGLTLSPNRKKTEPNGHSIPPPNCSSWILLRSNQRFFVSPTIVSHSRIVSRATNPSGDLFLPSLNRNHFLCSMPLE